MGIVKPRRAGRVTYSIRHGGRPMASPRASHAGRMSYAVVLIVWIKGDRSVDVTITYCHT
jgi:hypothetical protein